MKSDNKYPLVYVVIVTHNAMTWLNKCLTSIYESSVPVKVIIVDNASKDDTVGEIQKKFQKFLLIPLTENCGFGKANNIGIERAFKEGADYVFLLNQDAWIETETISSLVEIAQKNTEYGILTPVHLNGEGDGLDFGFSIYISASYCPNLISDVFIQNKQDIYEVQFVNAAAWLLTRKVIMTIGGFSPIYFHYGEDNDYLNRLKYHKLKIGITPNATIYHDRANRVSVRTDYELELCSKLIVSTNINEPYNQFKTILRTTINIIKYALRLRLNMLVNEIKCLSYLIFNAFKIYRVRKMTKKHNFTFLNCSIF